MVALRFYIDSLRVLVRSRKNRMDQQIFSLASLQANNCFVFRTTIQSGCVTAGGERHLVPHGRDSTSPAPLLACRATPTAPPHSVSPIPIAFLIPKIKFKKIPSGLPPVSPFPAAHAGLPKITSACAAPGGGHGEGGENRTEQNSSGRGPAPRRVIFFNPLATQRPASPS